MFKFIGKDKSWRNRKHFQLLTNESMGQPCKTYLIHCESLNRVNVVVVFWLDNLLQFLLSFRTSCYVDRFFAPDWSKFDQYIISQLFKRLPLSFEEVKNWFTGSVLLMFFLWQTSLAVKKGFVPEKNHLA